MNSLYIDTNILIYQSLSLSKLYAVSYAFMKKCHKKGIELVTSTETFQEIMYVAQRNNQLKQGLQTCKKSLEIVKVLDITSKTISLYLSFLQKNPQLISRDVLHLTSCYENGIEGFVTFDKQLLDSHIVPVYNPKTIINFSSS